MKKLLFLILITGFAFQVQAQEGAKIEFKTKEIDYGEVEKGSDGTRVFEFTNTGDAPLIIKNTKSSCGCTVPSKPEKPVMPGEKAEIKVHYNTLRVGPFRKTVTIYTNAVNVPNGVVVLKIKGKVIDPNNVDLKREKPASPVLK